MPYLLLEGGLALHLLAGEGLLGALLGLSLGLALGLGVLQPLLLLLVVLDPLPQFLLLHPLEHGVVALVVPQLAGVQMDHVRAHVVQERLKERVKNSNCTNNIIIMKSLVFSTILLALDLMLGLLDIIILLLLGFNLSILIA